MTSSARSRFRLALLVTGLASALHVPLIGTTIGLPVSRNYALDEIGDVSRGVRLGFDDMGRLIVIGRNACFVLNDLAWLETFRKREDTPAILQFVTDNDGIAYFGALAAWGCVEKTADGMLTTRNLRPADYPDWVSSTNFTRIVPTDTGVCFGGANGVVHWDRSRDEQVFFRLPGVTSIFRRGSRVFASSHSAGIEYLNLETGRAEPVGLEDLSAVVVDHAARVGRDRVLLATRPGRLLVFDGDAVSSWRGPLAGEPLGRVSGLQRLNEGGIALAVDGRGLFILSEEGEVRLALTNPEYHRIHDLAVHEPGVLWIAAEGMVQKLLYSNRVTIVDRRLGVPISWPQVVQWKGRTSIASKGQLYESVPSTDGLSTHFEPMRGQPPSDAWGIGANGSRMLIGNDDGVYAREDNSFNQVLADLNVGRLVMVSPDLCYALGQEEIAVIKWQDGGWIECASRVSGFGYPYVVHSAGNSAWIELGANRVARVSLVDDALQTRLIAQFPWSEPRWVNIGVAGSTVMLSGGTAGALFFDEDRDTFCEAPKLRQRLANSPYPVLRVTEDRHGTLWATHENGVFAIRTHPADGPDTAPLDQLETIVRDFQPRVQITGEDDVWISTETSLYHASLDVSWAPPASAKPFLVEVRNTQAGTNRFNGKGQFPTEFTMPYSQNSLEFRFFSGTYATMRPPIYEYTLSGSSNEWTTRSTDSLFVLHDLKDGSYRLTARIVDYPDEPVEVDFSITPPWHRSPHAYVAYVTIAVLGGCGIYFLTIRHTRKRNAFLENLVRERSVELQSTMSRLSEETRNAATLAERNRLAGEVHDSLQQGLSGLMLQLEATLRLPGLTPEVRTKLTVARNMVSFTRHEVQQAVWNLESQLLENADLPEALQKLADLISTGAPRVEVRTNGTSREVSQDKKHQLLRLAQEAITNAVRHGKARKIFVHLDYTDLKVSLEIFDDGCGFDPDVVFASGIGHFGLRGLRNRASKINADLQIISAPNRGTIVRIVTSLENNATHSHAPVASA